MIDAIDKPAIYITPDYVIQAVNAAYAETYQTRVKIGSSKCHQVSHKQEQPCDQHGEDCPLQQCRVSGRATSVVHIHTLPGGKQYCDILMKPVRDASGMTVGFLEILENIDYASADPDKDKMIGQSPAFRSLLNQINRAARSDIAVLLQGETGTGKELVAQALHDSSHRQEKPFVVIECTGLNESLFESELFGYEKGAFTGATAPKKGLVEVANGGTIFFDEIGDVPLNMQVKLLRLLETQCFRAVGGLKQKKADFRLICATHKDLLALVERGEFRKDLYYRIAGFPIHLPSLHERTEDIDQLADHFLHYSNQPNRRFSANALATLRQYPFPGNIRELKSAVEQAALLADEDIINVTDLPPRIQNWQATSATQQPTTLMPLDAVERDYLRRVVAQHEGTAETLASALGISQRTLYRKLQRYGIRLKHA
ncbi:sigma-54-dependent Fis family transcriptional regulator [Aestuariibacter halophilus]|uniref:Sigma-54-dependent Fis family transcriptional regulator n=1 Tax=Fluctibacter halophilus TaxID=226011 RepID=A0ABS8GDG2_9ALTE|nr:sigma-54-dependent Fis family transcriptional regulator [Aestuariibacter halophilus]MCC2617925.1 sigma-54-dependent Fis family transcriptional regulator [Aestuariibacter halophilus]